MLNNLSVPCRINNVEQQISVAYTIEMQDEIQVITCKVDELPSAVPTWLQMRKFELRSIKDESSYVPLFTYHESIKNMETLVFMEKTYEMVMEKENFTVLV